MGRTSISCSDETHEHLEGMKPENETWDDFLMRLADDMPAPSESGADLSEVLELLEEIQTELEGLDTGLDNHDVNRVREGVRSEVQDVISGAFQ